MCSSMKVERKNKLNRFTTLPELCVLLQRKALILRDPVHWPDRNDSDVIRKYTKDGWKVFAKCFCNKNETIHHWQAYASGSSGCCIEFNRDKLLTLFKGQGCIIFPRGTSPALFASHEGFVFSEMDPKEVEKVKTERPVATPFVKRYPYQFEHESRIIWQGPTKDSFKSIEIDLACITDIRLSPELHYESDQTTFNAIREFLVGSAPESEK